MLLLRRIHGYIGFFIAPSVLFFALSGSVQLFNLHEPHGSYRPPVLFQYTASVHKDQVLALGHGHEGPPPSQSPGQPQHEDRRPRSVATLLLKWFFLAVALCLAASTALGLYIGFKATRRKLSFWMLLIAGALIPIGLLSF